MIKLTTYKAPGLPIHGMITDDNGQAIIAINLASHPDDRGQAVLHELLHYSLGHLHRNITAEQAEAETAAYMDVITTYAQHIHITHTAAT